MKCKKYATYSEKLCLFIKDMMCAEDKYLFSLVDPGRGVVLPAAELFFFEPESDFVVGGFNGVRSVDDVSADIDAEITSDGTWLRVEWLGGTEHLSTGLDGVVTLPDHAADWTGSGILDEASEETLGGEIGVVLLEHFFTWSAEFHGDELETFGLESGDDGTDESSLDTVWLDHDVGSLFGGLHFCFFNLFDY